MFKKLTFAVLAVLLMEGLVFDQVGLTAYNQGAISVINSRDHLLQFEAKTFLNVNARFPRFEASVLIPFIKRPTHHFLFGGGLQFAFGNSELPNQIFFIPVQTEITPFSQARNLAFCLELAPLLVEDQVFIRSMFGLRYYFGKTKDSPDSQ